MTRRLAWAALFFGALLIVAAFVMCGLAIWTEGPDSGRWGGTAFVVGFPGLAVAFLSVLWLDVESNR